MTTALPIQLEPRTDETWHSFLTRTAAAHDCTVSTLALHLGVRDAHGNWPAYYGIKVAGDWAGRASAVLGLTVPDLRAMHLEALDQVALDLRPLGGQPGIQTTRRAAHASWVHLSGSSYCPRCLAEDPSWRLSWRLPWTTVCLHHQLLLVSACPDCGGIAGRNNRYNASVPARTALTPDGRLCEQPRTGTAVACAADLSQARAAVATTAARGRAELLASIIGGNRGTVVGTSYTALQTLQAWRHAIGLARHFEVADTDWGRLHRWGTPPRDPAVVDQLLAAAEPLVTAPDPGAAADVLDRWCSSAGIRSPNVDTFRRASLPSAGLQPVIDTLVRRNGRAHVLAQRRLSIEVVADMQHWTCDDVPQLVWSCALPPHLRTSRKPDQLILRTVVALIVARLRSGATDWATTAALLGLPSRRARGWTRHSFSSAHGPDLKGELIAAAHALARRLAEQPARGAWTDRPVLAGNGLSMFANAQTPTCRNDIPGGWCPCAAAATKETRNQ